MRAVVFVALALAPAIANAEKKLPSLAGDVHENRVINRGMPRPATLQISRKLYLNDCQPGGCVVTKSSFSGNSSLTNRSSIPQVALGTTVTLQPYKWGATHWDSVIECVRETFAPFNIEVLTEEPSGNHHEVMIAGTTDEFVYNDSAGGVAPFIDCGATTDNMLSFVFANQTNDIQYLCGAIAHEAGHTYGLSHNLDADDPMTYLDLGSKKVWQNFDANCGEDDPRQCECDGGVDGDTANSSFKENSFNYLREQFGFSTTLEDTVVGIDRPLEGAFVAPGFPIAAHYDSPLEFNRGSLSIDGQPFEDIPEENKLFAWAAPMDLTPGPHTLTFTAFDEADRMATFSVNITVLTSCADGGACPSGTVCFSDLCQPLDADAGGLGSTCTDNADCITGQCATDGTDSLCTGACEAGGTCPAGFECLGSNLCWPEQSGGCNSSGGNGAAFLLLGLAGLIATRRRTVRR